MFVVVTPLDRLQQRNYVCYKISQWLPIVFVVDTFLTVNKKEEHISIGADGIALQLNQLCARPLAGMKKYAKSHLVLQTVLGQSIYKAKLENKNQTVSGLPKQNLLGAVITVLFLF